MLLLIQKWKNGDGIVVVLVKTRSAPSVDTNWEGSGANPDDEEGDVDEEGSGGLSQISSYIQYIKRQCAFD